jgi:lysyl-tRNA synthetase class II
MIVSLGCNSKLRFSTLLLHVEDKIYKQQICTAEQYNCIFMPHPPACTSVLRCDVELLQAYADYDDLMNMTEKMVSEMVKEIKGSYKIQYHANGPGEPPVDIDFTPPWRRISMIEGLEEKLGVTIPKDLYSEEARAFLEKLCTEKEVDCKPPRVRSLCPRILLL